MARRRRSRGKRNRRRNTFMVSRMNQLENDICKGTILADRQVDINVNDYAGLKDHGAGQYISAVVTVGTTTMAEMWIGFWDGKTPNVCIHTVNFLLCNSTKTIRFRWPPRMYFAASEKDQLVVQIAHCATVDPAKDPRDGQFVWYNCQLTIRRCDDVMNLQIEPDHANIKHGLPSIRAMAI